jgi:hypothetical protein
MKKNKGIVLSFSFLLVILSVSLLTYLLLMLLKQVLVLNDVESQLIKTNSHYDMNYYRLDKLDLSEYYGFHVVSERIDGKIRVVVDKSVLID